jgi:hypothetical protein
MTVWLSSIQNWAGIREIIVCWWTHFQKASADLEWDWFTAGQEERLRYWIIELGRVGQEKEDIWVVLSSVDQTIWKPGYQIVYPVWFGAKQFLGSKDNKILLLETFKMFALSEIGRRRTWWLWDSDGGRKAGSVGNRRLNVAKLNQRIAWKVTNWIRRWKGTFWGSDSFPIRMQRFGGLQFKTWGWLRYWSQEISDCSRHTMTWIFINDES